MDWSTGLTFDLKFSHVGIVHVKGVRLIATGHKNV